jgi:hypothetical protein
VSGGYFVLAVTARAARRSRSGGGGGREIARLVGRGPTTAEMERAEAQAEATSSTTCRRCGFDGKSDQLNAYNVLRGDPVSSRAISIGTGRRRPRASATPRGSICGRIGAWS